MFPGRGLKRDSVTTCPKARGFTLLEVLLAMAILAILMTVIYSSFSTAGRNVERAEASRDQTDLARTLISKMSDDIANAYYNALITETVFYGKKTQGDRENERFDSLALTTLTNWRKPDSKETDLIEIGYHFEEKPEVQGRILMRREKRELSKDVAVLEGGSDFEVTDKVEGLRLRYFDGSAWADEWDSRTLRKLPRAVEITVMLADARPYLTVVGVGR